MAEIIQRTPLATLAKVMAFANKADGALLVLTGVLGFFAELTSPTLDFFSSVTLSIYVAGFGALLLRYEFAAGVDLRKDYGFMYTYMGRAAFLLLVANLGWGLRPLGWLAALLTNANAIISAYIMFAHPSFVSGQASATAVGGLEGEQGSELIFAGSCSSSSFDPASAAARARASSVGGY